MISAIALLNGLHTIKKKSKTEGEEAFEEINVIVYQGRCNLFYHVSAKQSSYLAVSAGLSDEE